MHSLAILAAFVICLDFIQKLAFFDQYTIINNKYNISLYLGNNTR